MCCRLQVELVILIGCLIRLDFWLKNIINPLDAGSRLTDFAQSSNAAGSLLSDCTVYERSG